MDIYLLHFILFLFFPASYADTDIEVKMVVDIIHAMERPSSIIATLCWPNYKKVQLYNALEGENVTGVTMMRFMKPGHVPRKHGQDQHVVFLADLNCPGIGTYFEKSRSENHFRSPFRWLLLRNGSEGFAVPEAIAHVDVLPDSEVIMATRVIDTFNLHFIYKVSSDSVWKIAPYGTWEEGQRFQLRGQKLSSLALRRQNLDRFEISIGYVYTDNGTIVHLEDGIDDHIDTLTKVTVPANNFLMDFLNASKRYVYTNTWGYRVNGTWNGLSGYLVRNEVEIGGSPMFFTSERISAIEYIFSPTPTRSKFVFQQPKLSYENNLFLLSFRTTVWYSAIALIFLLYLVLLAVAIWEWKRNKSDEDEERVKDAGILRGNIQDVALLILGATCQQGSPTELKGSLGRIVMLILFLALMFLYTSYAANIVALLQSSSSKIRNLDDLLHSRLKFGVHDTIFNRYYFSTATEPIRKAIYQTKVAPRGQVPRFMPLEEGVKNIRKGLFAFHMEVGVGYKFVGQYFQESEKCGLEEIQYLQVVDPYLAVRKNTPYIELFKIGYKRIQESGLQNRENLRFYAKKPKCTDRGSSFVSVSMVDCYPALLVLTYGVTAAMFIMVIEILYHKRQTIKRKICCKKRMRI